MKILYSLQKSKEMFDHMYSLKECRNLNIFSLSTVYRGPFVTIKQMMASFSSVQFIGGQGDFMSCGAEGIAQVSFKMIL